MISLTDPVVVAYCRHNALSPDEGALLGFVDWLQERDATAADLALLFVGTPPEHADGIPQNVLALWLRCQGDYQQSALVWATESMRWYSNQNDNTAYAFGVKSMDETPLAFVNTDSRFNGPLVWRWQPNPTIAVQDLPSGHPIFGAHATMKEARLAAERSLNLLARARRDLKRRILSLPWAQGVRVERQVTIPHDLWEAALNERLTITPADVRTGQKPRWVRSQQIDQTCQAAGFTPNDSVGMGFSAYQNEPGPSPRPSIVWRRQPNGDVTMTQILTAPELIWPEPRTPGEVNLVQGSIREVSFARRTE